MAAEDPYQTLGVQRDATQEQIRAAYRKLAKKHHPDLNPGNKPAEERFKAISGAYDLLSDPDKRARFDRGEIDAAGQERPEQHFYRRYAEGQEGGRYRAGEPGMPEEELGDILSEFFGRGRGEGGTIRMHGRDQHFTLTVEFLDAVRGNTRRLVLPDGRGLDVRVPPGIEDGQTLRLKGQGGPGIGGGPPGDALIEIEIAPHAFYRRDGRDIQLQLPVTLAEAVLGARISVPTPHGAVTMTIPAGSDTGTRLRLRGKGVAAHGSQAAGDEYVTLQVVVGETDAALEGFLRDWAPKHRFDPRRGMVEQ
ncbi:MAG TPA: DnaJ C-terminal domain-containing protein [Acetobacteraceae bacterium]|nr:DnaJ C-terminal domain-containing protein [Acetobacteraceae bacterium]